MSNDYSREVLRRTVAQVCQMIGWQGINSTPLDILVHVLEKYILTLGTQTHRYAEQFNRTEPNLHDLGLVFKDIQVRLPELREYTRCVPPVSCQLKVPSFPLPKESHLNFLKPGSQEVVTRPVHVHEYLPAMYPEKEKETTPLVADIVEIVHNGIPEHENDMDCKSPEISVTDTVEKPRDLFKKPTDPVSTPPGIKKPRLKLEEEDCHTREISSVMMTMSGFLSPAREGKLPEARTPVVIPEPPPEKIKNAPHFNPLAAHPLIAPPADRPDKKSKQKRTKAVNGKIEKVKKKDRGHKNALGKMKNSENRIDKLAMHLARGKVRPSGSVKHQISEIPPLKQLPPSLENNHLKMIKQEVGEKPSKVPPDLPPVPLLPPIPKLHKNPLVLHHNVNTISEPLPIVIKEEKLDGEKLTSQPDKSKLNIFKKISTKIKEEKSHDYSHYERHIQDTGAPKLEKAISTPRCPSPDLVVFEAEASKQRMVHIKESIDFVVNNCAVDLTSKKSVSVTEVINIDDDSNDNKRHVFKTEPLDELPRDLSKPKASAPVAKLASQPIIKEKKERKRKERKPKIDKAAKEFAKMLKDSSMPNNLPLGYSMFPGLPRHALIPGPGIIPSPGLIPTGGLFSGANNPALRGMMLPEPNFLPNPFSQGGSGLTGPGGFLPGAPGLGMSPAALMTHSNHGFGQLSRMHQHLNFPPFFRRPSLEVIPLDDMDEPHSKGKQSNFPLTVKEKDKRDKQKNSSNNSFMLNSSLTVRTSPAKQSPPKPNPIIKMPPIKPDITIKLNPPEKQKIIEPKVEPIISDVSVMPPKEKEKDKSERKKDKLHKKERKDKEQKIKKKKDKKDKLKIKLEKKKDKEERHDSKERLKKEKKEKRKEKEKAKEKTLPFVEAMVPKLTLKLGPPSPMLPPSPDNTRRLNIKPIVKKDEVVEPPESPIVEARISEERLSVERSQSPELARISALVTRPPKIKSSSKHNTTVKLESAVDLNRSLSPPPPPSNSSPGRKNRPPSSFSKLKRIYFKPIPKRTGSGFDDFVVDVDSAESAPTPIVNDVIPNVPLGTPYYINPQGNKVWICPACGKPDNGSPMIGCDGCDGWYHWVCVGIHIAPDDSEDWYCTACIAKRTAMASAMAGGQTGKKRGRKPKAEKLKEPVF